MSARPSALKRLGSLPPGLEPPQRQPRQPQQHSLVELATSHTTPSPGPTGEGVSRHRTSQPIRGDNPNLGSRPTATAIQDYNQDIHPDPPSPARRSGWSRIGVSTPSTGTGTADAGPMQASGEDVAMLVVPDLFDVLDQLGDAVVTLDREFRIVAHNTAAGRLGRRPVTDLAPAPLWDSWISPTGGTLEEDLRRAMSERIPLHIEHHTLSATGDDVLLQVRSEERRVGKECRSRWS